jgi:hypothetical protein
MDRNDQTATVRWKAGAIVLAAILAIVIVGQRLEARQQALGQVPDAGAQRQQMIKELQFANQQLGSVIDLLKEIRDQRGDKPKHEEPKREQPKQP